DGDFLPGPSREQVAEDGAADSTVQVTDSVDRAAASNREIGHVERFALVGRIVPSEREEFAERDPGEAMLHERIEVTSDQNRIEAVKARRNRRMGGEQIAGACRRQSDLERLARLLHEASSAFEDRECS